MAKLRFVQVLTFIAIWANLGVLDRFVCSFAVFGAYDPGRYGNDPVTGNHDYGGD